jgi:hypothetical protein
LIAGWDWRHTTGHWNLVKLLREGEDKHQLWGRKKVPAWIKLFGPVLVGPTLSAAVQYNKTSTPGLTLVNWGGLDPVPRW